MCSPPTPGYKYETSFQPILAQFTYETVSTSKFISGPNRFPTVGAVLPGDRHVLFQ
jgi:hypothetical protein